MALRSTGVVRRLDSLGRITLPMELRREYDLWNGAKVFIYTKEDCIIVQKCSHDSAVQNAGDEGISFCTKTGER